MHELSIAMSLIDVACEQAALMDGARVEALHVRIGPLSGVVPDALRFSFDLACDGTPIAGARLVIEETPLVVHCPKCDESQVLASPQELRCPVCQTLTADVVRGYELELFALEVEQRVPTNG